MYINYFIIATSEIYFGEIVSVALYINDKESLCNIAGRIASADIPIIWRGIKRVPRSDLD